MNPLFVQTALKRAHITSFRKSIIQLRIRMRSNDTGKLKSFLSTLEAEKTRKLDLTFNDHEAACRSKSNLELIRGYIVFSLCSIEYINANNLALLKIGKRILGKTMFDWLMKATFFGHFVAGETRKEVDKKMKRMEEFNVKPILDYSAEEDVSGEVADDLVGKAVKPKDPEPPGSSMAQYDPNRFVSLLADLRFRVTSARTYFYLDEASCEKNLMIFMDSLIAASNVTSGRGLTAVKMTALGRPQLLLQLSEVIMKARNFATELTRIKGNVADQDLTADALEAHLKRLGINEVPAFLEKVTVDKKGIIHLFPWTGIVKGDLTLNDSFLIPCMKQKKMVRLLSKLSEKEEEIFKNMIRRLKQLVETARDLNVGIMVDAEQSYFQPAITRLVLELMNIYNKERCVVFNTYQCYLKSAKIDVIGDMKQAERQDFHFGAKIVRGAYMEQERMRSTILAYEDPILPCYNSTTAMYYDVVEEFMKRIKGDRVSAMMATHNEDTVRHVITRMKEMKLSPNANGMISFAQLLGMCDYITYPMGEHGYHVYKYVPYGRVDLVIPYLSRRANENKGMFQKTKKEKKIILAELKRRLQNGQILPMLNTSRKTK